LSATAAPPRIDPRIRARRIEVQRTEGRRRLRKVVIAVVLVGILAGGWGITRTPLLDVDHLRVRGAARTGDLTVVGTSGIELGDALLTAPLGRAASRIARLPWVQTVKVRRSWPGTVVITVVERTPIVAVPARGGQWVLVDAEARQLELSKEPDPKLVRVDVAPVEPKLGTELTGHTAPALQVAASIPATLHDQIVSLRPAAGGSVEGTVRLRNGAEARLEFGTPTQLAAKWLALLSVLDEVDPAHVAGIDVRVPAAPALTGR
jgi:cell division protein FtsQ